MAPQNTRRSRTRLPRTNSRAHNRVVSVSRQIGIEHERRRQLTPAERLAEDRKRNLARLKKSSVICLFQPASPRGGRASCSYDGCLHGNTHQDQRIDHEYRIAIVTHHKAYYHVDCFETMVDVQELLACNKLCADNSPYRWNGGQQWSFGLMFCKWFEHKGCISLDAITAYIDRYKKYEADRKDFDAKFIDAELNNDPGRKDMKAPQQPILEGYTTSKEDSCKLSAIMKHEYNDVMYGTDDPEQQ